MDSIERAQFIADAKKALVKDIIPQIGIEQFKVDYLPDYELLRLDEDTQWDKLHILLESSATVEAPKGVIPALQKFLIALLALIEQHRVIRNAPSWMKTNWKVALCDQHRREVRTHAAALAKILGQHARSNSS